MDYSSGISGIILGFVTLKKVMQLARDALPLTLVTFMILNSFAVLGGAVIISLYYRKDMSSLYNIIAIVTA